VASELPVSSEQVEVLSMTKLRAYLVALTILATALAPLLLHSGGARTLSNPLAFAAPAGDNGDSGNGNGNSNSNANNNSNSNNNNSNSNANNNSNSNNNNNNNNNNNANNNSNSNNNNSNGNNNNSNANSNNNNDNDGDNSGDNGGDNQDNDNGDSGGGQSNPPARSNAPAPSLAPACSTPGQDMTFQSSDGRVDVHVFPSLTQSVKFSIRMPIDPASVPPPPGPPVGALLFQLLAEGCNGGPIPVLPAEVNLGAHYSDADAAGRNEANFTLARLDTNTNQWGQVAKQASDPNSNLTSATITDMGYYVLYQK